MERRASPVPRKSTVGCIASFFEKRKKIDSFERPQYSKEESAAEDDLFNRGLSQTHIFSYKELNKATDGFKQEIGTGGYGTVYLGKLQDNRLVAVKVLRDRNKKEREKFINEVLLLSQIRHKNLVSLYGCVNPQTESASRELILVYELVSNGTLSDHLHGHLLPLSWPRRLRIAVETAEALTYLHSVETPVVHRDVKPDNILLDSAFHVKVADFGISRFLPSDGTQLSTLTPGTQGYHDPEYEKVYTLTSKSDVYSFGVVLLELISSEKAVDVNRVPDNVYLAEMAYKKIMNNELEQLVDPKLGYHLNDEVRRTINSVAELACRCLQQSGNMRPSMLEVFDILKGLQSEMQLEVQESRQEEPQRLCPPTVFSYDELEKATDCFSVTGLISEDMFYTIYLGILQDGRMASVKVLEEKSTKRDLEKFWTEVTILTATCHKNLIALYGYTSRATKKLMIVHEFVPNGTLEDHLYGQQPALPLAVRIEIAIEAATALEYLHSLEPSIIHRDVKASNILLDNDFHAKVSGLDYCYVMAWDEAKVDDICGTTGYMAPEYIIDGIVTAKSDVYGFGMVLLELILGKRAVDIRRDERVFKMGLCTDDKRVFRGRWKEPCILNSDLEELADPRLGYHSNSETRTMIREVAELASSCLYIIASKRPSMMEVLVALKDIRDGTRWTYYTNWLKRRAIDEPGEPDKPKEPVEEGPSSWEFTDGR